MCAVPKGLIQTTHQTCHYRLSSFRVAPLPHQCPSRTPRPEMQPQKPGTALDHLPSIRGTLGREINKKEKCSYTQFPQKDCVQLICSTMVGGGWRLAVGGDWRLAVGKWRLVVVGGGWRLVIGGWWRLVAGGGWRLLVHWGGP